ncbi:hypothetical protein BJ875DRAFT_466572 [Amylocarpus encephaloides]|uniref:Uncharacterized protein n=1 Tax=Amylocarpus encephaloides TaxID=45428 RepID=A0A9P7YFL8_9HELO|nr:hypothetical protein BJ875DRAFT_466572 [Amylocarpus encephaloides]
MLFISSIIALALARSVDCYVAPTDLLDGLYSIAEDSNTPVLLAAANSSDLAAREMSHPHDIRSLLERGLDNPIVTCDGYQMNLGEYSVARGAMNDWCNNRGGYITDRNGVFYSYGSAIAYLCNHFDGTNTCYHEFDTADALLDVNCAGDRAGSVHVERYYKTLGRCNAGIRFCF